MIFKLKCQRCKQIFEAKGHSRKNCDECKPSARAGNQQQCICKNCGQKFKAQGNFKVHCSPYCKEQTRIKGRKESWVNEREFTPHELRERHMKFNVQRLS